MEWSQRGTLLLSLVYTATWYTVTVTGVYSNMVHCYCHWYIQQHGTLLLSPVYTATWYTVTVTGIYSNMVHCYCHWYIQQHGTLLLSLVYTATWCTVTVTGIYSNMVHCYCHWYIQQHGTLLLSLVYTATWFIKLHTKHWGWEIYSAIHDAGHTCSRWYISDTNIKAPLVFKLLSHSGPKACYPT